MEKARNHEIKNIQIFKTKIQRKIQFVTTGILLKKL